MAVAEQEDEEDSVRVDPLRRVPLEVRGVSPWSGRCPGKPRKRLWWTENAAAHLTVRRSRAAVRRLHGVPPVSETGGLQARGGGQLRGGQPLRGEEPP